MRPINALQELRSDRATDKVKAVMYDTVEILQHALKGHDVDAVTVQVQEPAKPLPCPKTSTSECHNGLSLNYMAARRYHSQRVAPSRR